MYQLQTQYMNIVGRCKNICVLAMKQENNNLEYILQISRQNIRANIFSKLYKKSMRNKYTYLLSEFGHAPLLWRLNRKAL